MDASPPRIAPKPTETAPRTTPDEETEMKGAHNETEQKVVTTSLHANVPATSASSNPPNEGTSDQKILALLRQSILPFSDRLDPFAALPVSLDRLQEHLVSFYLIHYPKVTYGFSPRLRPHPVATNFSIALTTPACFQVILARSALYRLNLSKYAGEKEKKALEVVMMRHKGEALRLIRVLSAKSSPTRKDDLIASIISLGTLDRRTGSDDAAEMHFMAVRRILKATGGPLAVRSLLLSRVMVFFECIYGTPTGSYIWEPPDLKHLLPELTAFFGRIWTLWKYNAALSELRAKDADSRSSSNSSDECEQPYLRPGSALHTIITRAAGPAEPSEEDPLLPKHRMQLIFQLTCLLTLVAVILNYSQLPPSAQVSTFSVSKYTQTPSASPQSTSLPSASSASTASESFATSKTPRRLAPKPPPSLTSHGSTPSPTSTTALAPHTSSNQPSAAVSSSADTTEATATNTQPTSPTASPSPLQAYLTDLHNTVENLDLLSQPANNVMWQIQINDHSEAHSRRIWKAASYAWVLKHTGWNVQMHVKKWLVGFMTAEDVEGERRFRLEPFHFSYAA